MPNENIHYLCRQVQLGYIWQTLRLLVKPPPAVLHFNHTYQRQTSRSPIAAGFKIRVAVLELMQCHARVNIRRFSTSWLFSALAHKCQPSRYRNSYRSPPSAECFSRALSVENSSFGSNSTQPRRLQIRKFYNCKRQRYVWQRNVFTFFAIAYFQDVLLLIHSLFHPTPSILIFVFVQ